MVIGLLGILKAGGAYLPLDPAYPAERTAFVLNDTRAPVIVTQAHLADRLPATAATVLALLFWLTTPLAALLAALTSATYLSLYTPLKRVTTLNTHIGAVPGALPALIGWAAVRGTLEPGAWAIFMIVYVWQLPHFLSIAWLYREDYARGGFRMLPGVDPGGRATGRQAALGALALLPVSLLPAVAGVCGMAYGLGAVVLGLLFVQRAAAFAWSRSPATARGLLRASLLYLPLLLALMFLDQVP